MESKTIRFEKGEVFSRRFLITYISCQDLMKLFKPWYSNYKALKSFTVQINIIEYEKPLVLKRTNEVYRDGGTTVYLDPEGNKYFMDKRISNRETHGKIFDRYPGEPDADIIKVPYKLIEDGE